MTETDAARIVRAREGEARAKEQMFRGLALGIEGDALHALAAAADAATDEHRAARLLTTTKDQS